MKKHLITMLSFAVTLAMVFSMIALGAKPVMADSESTKLETYPYESTLWTGIETFFSETWFFNENGYKVTSVKSSNPTIIKVMRDGSRSNIESYWLVPKKSGKATVTVTYKTKAGKTASQKLTRTVKKCPQVFKSLEVNGKSVNLSEHKSIYDAKYTGTAPRVKLALNGDWQIVQKYGWLVKFKKNGDFSRQKDFIIKARKTLLQGKAFSFPKTWDNFGMNIVLENDDGDLFEYRIDLNRKTFN